MKRLFVMAMGISVSSIAIAIDINQQTMNLYVGQSEFINDNSITNVAVGSDEILNAIPVQKKGVLITGVKSGDTTVKVWRAKSLQTINTHVYPANFLRMLNDINYFLNGNPNVSVRVLGDRIVVEGEQLDTAEKTKIDAFLSQFSYITNLTTAKSQAPNLNDTRMVYFDVKIIEASKNDMDNIGIQWGTQINGPQVGIAGEIKKSRIYQTAPETMGLTGVPAGGRISPFSAYAGIISAITSKINLMQSQGLAKLVAHPVLSCKNGGNATFLSGGQVPYSTASATGTPSVDFKDYGIKLNVSPTIQSDGSIVAKITSEISEIDSAVQVNGVPGLLTRKTETEFSLKNGEGLVLSGLNSTQRSDTNNNVPGVSRVPVVGKLFQNKQSTDKQTELLFVVTPYVYSAPTPVIKESIANAENLAQKSNSNNILLPKDFFNSQDNRVYFDKLGITKP